MILRDQQISQNKNKNRAPLGALLVSINETDKKANWDLPAAGLDNLLDDNLDGLVHLIGLAGNSYQVISFHR